MPNLCYIIYIGLFIRTFGSQTTLNDPSLIQFVLYLIKMMGEWQTHLQFCIIIISFFRIFSMGGWGGPEKDQNLL